MGRPKQARNLWGSLKDRLSLLLLLCRHRSSASTTALRLAILKATSHDPSTSPPPVLLISGPSAAAACDVLLSRLHHTRDAFVAVKCLLSLRHLLNCSHVGFNFRSLNNLSNFRDQSKPDAWQISLWARWFAQEIENYLSLSSLLCFPSTDQDPKRRLSGLPDSSLLRESGALVSMVEQLGTAPDSLHYQTLALIHDVMKVAGEDYRTVMRQLFARIRAIEDGGRLAGFDEEALSEWIGLLDRMEASEEKMLLMFLNKKRNDGVWDAVKEAKAKAIAEKRRRDNAKKLALAERTRWERPRGARWLDVHWNKALTVTPHV